jgi:esterase/lipase superfamily enzyme
MQVPLRHPLTLLLSTCSAVLLAACAAAMKDTDGKERTAQAAPEKGGGVSVTTIFYVTNRSLADDGVKAEYFGDQRGTVHYGTCSVRFTPVPGAEELTYYGQFSPPREIRQFIGAREMSATQFREEIAKRTREAGGRELVAYFHGYNTGFIKACRRAATLARTLQDDGDLVLFSWPSAGSAVSYTRDESNAEWSQADIENFLAGLIDTVGASDVQLVGYSMGARVLVDALVHMQPRHEDAVAFDRLVLIAPDIDTAMFRAILPVLRMRVHSITLYASRNDTALKLSRQIHGYPRLGEAGADLPLLEGVETIDVSNARRYSFSGHIYHLYNPAVSADLSQLLGSGTPAEHRTGLAERRQGAMRYWEMIAPPEERTGDPPE